MLFAAVIFCMSASYWAMYCMPGTIRKTYGTLIRTTTTNSASRILSRIDSRKGNSRRPAGRRLSTDGWALEELARTRTRSRIGILSPIHSSDSLFDRSYAVGGFGEAEPPRNSFFPPDAGGVAARIG